MTELIMTDLNDLECYPVSLSVWVFLPLGCLALVYEIVLNRLIMTDSNYFESVTLSLSVWACLTLKLHARNFLSTPSSLSSSELTTLLYLTSSTHHYLNYSLI